MWILPRPLHTSPFVQDTGGLISDLQEQSQISAQSLLVRSKPLPVRTWLAKWKRDSWTALLSGRILKPSLGISFVERWTSSLEASLASHSVVQESETEMKTHDISSHTFWTALEGAGLPLFSLKMLKESSPQNSMEKDGMIQQERQFCSMSSESWKEWVIKQRQEYSARVNAAHLTRERGSSSWPTISVNEAKNSQGKSQLNRNTPPLGTAVLLADYTSNGSQTRIPRQEQGHEGATGIADNGSGQIWPSRPGQPQFSWEPPRVVGNAANKGCQGSRGQDDSGGQLLGSTEPDRSGEHGDMEQEQRKAEPSVGGDANGTPRGMGNAELSVSCDNRTDELRLLGNGVVPATAELAFRTLLKQLTNTQQCNQ